MDPVDLFERGSVWTKEKIAGAKDALDAQTPCEEWKVRDVVNHLIEGQQYFQKAARGEEATPPSPTPTDLLAGDDPVQRYEETRLATLEAFRSAGEDKAVSMGIAFVDTVVHGADIARATGQDDSIPSDLAEAAFGMVNGRLTDDRRGKAFKPEVNVPEAARIQDKLLAYLGRQP